MGEIAPGQLQVGDRVVIKNVTWPDDPRHSSFIGGIGTVTRTFKTKLDEVRVDLDDSRVRYCNPEFLDLIAPDQSERGKATEP